MTKALKTPSDAVTPTRVPIVIANGTLEALKWLAVVLMVVDHSNKFLLDGKVGWMSALGRIVMPIFAFVLAYNLARPGALAQGRFARTAKRLLIYGAIATIPHIALTGTAFYGWPLNILFTLLGATLVIWLFEAQPPKYDLWILPLFTINSLLPEYWMMGTGTTIAAYFYCKTSRPLHLWIWIFSVFSLFAINLNLYALLAVPLLLLAPKVQLNVPRFQYFFYAFYPAHLAILWVVRGLMH